ncbi:ribose 5-phosphate isomerase A [Candidatus Aerophobetes bacterium]|uniref:Ribose 5-phosphate isomerase A n=1 Tax=Aerophobetes bacterium TaxID=2030807 RepID=A0A2A4X803_UNCAE|nr:MAG: ribose 5-phosphate isomerase A [Candidatus Aerophobetes bacterium]
MYIGIGTGSTVHYFIKALGIRCKEGLNVRAIASSKQSEKLAKESGITIVEPLPDQALDITVDGADLVFKDRSLIKGGGGALLREKILANAAKKFVVIVDASKIHTDQKKVAWPVEIIPFASALTLQAIRKLSIDGTIRLSSGTTPYLTDNGNYIFDVNCNQNGVNPHQLHSQLLALPGVMETGFFPPIATKIIVGTEQLTTYEFT